MRLNQIVLAGLLLVGGSVLALGGCAAPANDDQMKHLIGTILVLNDRLKVVEAKLKIKVPEDKQIHVVRQ